MFLSEINNVSIAGVSSVFPSSKGQFYSNEEVISLVEKITGQAKVSPEALSKKFGIDKRYWVSEPGKKLTGSDPTSYDLMEEAAKKLVDSENINPREIDLIIAVTTTAPFYTSVLSTRIANFLKVNCACFDMKSGCSSIIYALTTAYSYLNSGAKKVLIVCAETISKVMDTATSVPYFGGDGGGAILLTSEESNEGKLVGAYIDADGKYANSLGVPGILPPTQEALDAKEYLMRLNQDPNEFIDEKWKTLPQLILDKFGLDSNAIDAYIPHQVSKRLIQLGASSLGLEENKTISSFRNHGNCGSVSIVLALDHAIKNKLLNKGEVGMLAAVGGGISWGGLLLRL